MDMLKAWKSMTSLQKIFLLVSIATIFCSVFTDCVLCKHWPLSVEAKWRNPLEGFDSDTRLVLYKTSTCPHCRNMMSEWDKVVGDAATLGFAVKTVDANDDPEETNAAQVESFPTIKLYKGSKVLQYTGERTATAIESWAKSQ
jgi:thiol-disulfide isomerase/thioredoxin